MTHSANKPCDRGLEDGGVDTEQKHRKAGKEEEL